MLSLTYCMELTVLLKKMFSVIWASFVVLFSTLVHQYTVHEELDRTCDFFRICIDGLTCLPCPGYFIHLIATKNYLPLEK